LNTLRKVAHAPHVAIVPSPFLGDHDAPVALWHSDVDYALDYLDITDVRAVLS